MNNTILIDDTLDLDASHYVRHSSLQNDLAKKALKKCHLKQNANILDVGCGDGRITAELANYAKQGQVIGIDASSNMIEFASVNFPKSNFPNLEFRLETAEEMILAHQFDLIVSFSCFHWLKDPKKVVHKLSSSLKTGGEILILTYPNESPYYRYLQKALQAYPEYYTSSAYNTMLSIQDYKQLFRENKFNIINFQLKNLHATYNNLDEVREYIKGWLNIYVKLPENLYDSFFENINRAITDDPNTYKDGKIIIPYTALIIKARKK